MLGLMIMTIMTASFPGEAQAERTGGRVSGTPYRSSVSHYYRREYNRYYRMPAVRSAKKVISSSTHR